MHLSLKHEFYEIKYVYFFVKVFEIAAIEYHAPDLELFTTHFL